MWDFRAATRLVIMHATEYGVVGESHDLEHQPRFTLAYGFEQLMLVTRQEVAKETPRWRLSDSAQMLFLFKVTR